ncbi:hypothetical protein CICLE_v10023622mg, partial [Citrus x clementina]
TNGISAYDMWLHRILLGWALIPQTHKRPNSRIRKVKTRTLTVLLSNSPLSVNPDSGSTPPSPILQSCPIPKIIAAPLVLRMSAAKLKSRIEKYLGGDEDAVPSIFEAILSRKLSGKHDQSDDELMEELQIRTKTSDRDANEEDEFDSGSDS